MPTWSIAMSRSSRPGLHVGDRHQTSAGCSGRFMGGIVIRAYHAAGLTRRSAPGGGRSAPRSTRSDARASSPHAASSSRRIAVIDECVGQPEMQHRHRDAGGREALGDRAAGAARDDVFLDRDERVVRARELRARARVERLHEAHVGDGRVELVGGGERGRSTAPNARIAMRSRAALRFAAHLALADRQRRHARRRPRRRGRCRADSAPPPACRSWNAV